MLEKDFFINRELFFIYLIIFKYPVYYYCYSDKNSERFILAKNKIDEGKASHNMVNSNKNEYFLFTLIYFSLTVLIPAFIIEVFDLDFVFFIVFILYSLLPFAVIFGILLRVDVINGIKLVYEKNSNLSIEEIAQKSGTSEDMVLYILSKIKSKEEAQQLKFIQKNNFSMRGKIPDDSVIDKFKENEIMEIDPKCEVSFEANKLNRFSKKECLN